MRGRRLVIMGISLGAAATAAGQAPAAGLPEDLRAHVRDARFDAVSSVRGLPLGVRSELQNLFGTQTLDMAEAGAPFQGSSATADLTLPSRRLVSAGCSYEDCLVVYEQGGRAARTQRVLLFHWTPQATTFEWGGTAPGGGLKTIDAVRRAVLTSAVKTSAGPW
jgi:hypothetical protein